MSERGALFIVIVLFVGIPIGIPLLLCRGWEEKLRVIGGLYAMLILAAVIAIIATS